MRAAEGPLGSRLASATLLYVFVVLGIFLVFAPWTTLWERAIVAWLHLRPPEVLEESISMWMNSEAPDLGELTD